MPPSISFLVPVRPQRPHRQARFASIRLVGPLALVVLVTLIPCAGPAPLGAPLARADLAPPRRESDDPLLQLQQPELRGGSITVRPGKRPWHGLVLRLINPLSEPVTLSVETVTWVDAAGNETRLRVQAAILRGAIPDGPSPPRSEVVAPPRSNLQLVIVYDGFPNAPLRSGGLFRVVARLAAARVVVDVPLTVRPRPPLRALPPGRGGARS
jgi:hypothetical protein